jgi:c-di-GMP-binding flagellar brake protein YcgR
MPNSAPSAMAPPSAPCPVAANRRLTIRYGCAATAQISAADEILSPFQRVRVHDISQGGIGLILPQAPAVGDTIFLQMTNNLLEFTYDLAAEVRHVATHPHGSWLVGVAFDEPLSTDDLAGLI